MIEIVEETFEWVRTHSGGEFLLVEDVDVLVKLRPKRTDIQRQRIAEGWHLVASHPTEENAQLLVVDFWCRTAGAAHT